MTEDKSLLTDAPQTTVSRWRCVCGTWAHDPIRAERCCGAGEPISDAPQPSKESTLIAENIVMRWRGGYVSLVSLTEIDVPLVLAIAIAIDKAAKRQRKLKSSLKQETSS